MQGELEKVKERYFDLYEHAPSAYLTINDRGLILDANLTAGGVLGVSRSEMLKTPFTRYLTSADQDVYYKMHRRLVDTGEHQHCEVRLAPRGSAPVWVLIEATNDHGEDGSPVSRLVMSDITHERAAQDELRMHRDHLEDLVAARTAELLAVNTELMKATEAKSTFLANMSHELRTPLNSVIGFSQVLLKGLAGPLNDEERRQIGMIKDAGTHLLALIDDVLDMSRVETGKTVLQTESFDAGVLVDEVISALTPLAHERGITLSKDEASEDAVIVSDILRVRQILINLVGNAIKFTDEGSVFVALRLEKDGSVVFSVTDTGCGIAEANLGRIFEAFVQLDSADRIKPSGTGLGLALSLDYARLLGGTITAASQMGVGTTLTLKLPSVPSAADDE